jgi:hypothetical protein
MSLSDSGETPLTALWARLQALRILPQETFGQRHRAPFQECVWVDVFRTAAGLTVRSVVLSAALSGWLGLEGGDLRREPEGRRRLG